MVKEVRLLTLTLFVDLIIYALFRNLNLSKEIGFKFQVFRNRASSTIFMKLTDNQPPNQTTMPYPPNYSGSGNPSNQSTTPFLPNYPRVPGEPSSQPQPQPQPQLQPQPPPHNANQNFAPPSEAGRIFVSTSYAISPNPVKMTCPTCHTSIKTATISDHQPSAHICCIVLCLLG